MTRATQVARSGRRNIIINGDFNLWSLGTRFINLLSTKDVADNFTLAISNQGIWTVEKDLLIAGPSIVQAGTLFNNSAIVTVTTADATTTAPDFVVFQQSIQGYNIRSIYQQPFTLSFWVYASLTGTYCVSFRNIGLDRSYVATYTVSTANTWEYKVIKVTALPSGGTWNFESGVGLTVGFTLASGSTFLTTANAWQVGNFIATTAQVNVAATVNNVFRVTGVQLEHGTTPTDFDFRHIQAEQILTLNAQQSQVVIATKPNNAIINGKMNIWQRGLSFVAPTGAPYTADKWAYTKVGSMVHTVSQSTDVPTPEQAGANFVNSIAVTLTTAPASLATGDYTFLFQRIEGYNFAPLAQNAMTLSFWVKSSIVATYSVAFRSGGFDMSYVTTFSVNIVNTWVKKTINIPASPSGGTWNYDTGIGLDVAFTLASGSTFLTTANTWQTGNFIGVTGMSNGVVTGSGTFLLTGVQLESGTVASPFLYRSYGEELALCQRYYEKSYDYSVPIGTINDVRGVCEYFVNGFSTSVARSARMVGTFLISKRVTPIFNHYSWETGVVNKIRDNGNNQDLTPTGNSPSMRGWRSVVSQSIASTSVQLLFHWTAEADL